MKIEARLELTSNELDYLDNLMMDKIKDVVQIDIEVDELDKKLKCYKHTAYELTKKALLEDKEIILSLISKIKEVA